MDPSFFTKGAFIGLSIAAPVGPIGVLCIRRSVMDGRWAGFIAGMGAATADAVYGCIAGFGLTSISGFLVRRESWLSLIGGVFLCYLGVRAIRATPQMEAAPERRGSLLALYASTLLLTLANPATILSFVVVFAALGLGASISYTDAGTLVFGVFLGSALWWLLLSFGVGLLRTRLNSAWITSINRVSGATLIIFGLYTLSHL